MLRYIAIDTSAWPEKTAVHVLRSKGKLSTPYTVEGGYEILHSTVIDTSNMDEVGNVVEKVMRLYKISPKLVFRRNVKENLGQSYEQIRTSSKV